MLIYLGRGERRYMSKPITLSKRKGWEFQAVVRGSISLLKPEGQQSPKSSHLWLFPPHHEHGWTGGNAQPAEIAVFHYLFVPEPLGRLVRHAGSLEMALNYRQCQRLSDLAKQAERYWEQPAAGMTICYEQILMELSLLLWEAHSHLEHSHREDLGSKKVSFAMSWFSERMSDNPSQEEVAKAAGTSVSHLRRLFHEVLQSSPKLIFDQLRFQRAMQLMGDPDSKLTAVGEACGFQSVSAFSRAFKIKFGCSPGEWVRANG